MSEREAFLAAIYDNPMDDSLKLVFADWLDEHEEPLLSEIVRRIGTDSKRLNYYEMCDCDCDCDGDIKWINPMPHRKGCPYIFFVNMSLARYLAITELQERNHGPDISGPQP